MKYLMKMDPNAAAMERLLGKKMCFLSYPSGRLFENKHRATLNVCGNSHKTWFQDGCRPSGLRLRDTEIVSVAISGKGPEDFFFNLGFNG